MKDSIGKLKIDPAVWECPECGAKHSIEEWDRATLTKCTNRRARRSYKSLGIESCRQQGSRRVYLCPSCEKMIQGYMIRPEFQ